ncbi:SDR family oxidoreductase [Hymenobacter algoricola]|uniref:SDR family oxidoreductase n=1 Tax=Hymenobacter algoricola TaxID=486267 RepID=A0ABP7NWE2_9BACT
MSHTILVTGATGTVGSELVKALANRGLTVRAGVHSLIKGDRLKQLNPEVQLVEIDYARPETLHVALTGVERVFMLTPFSEDQVEIGKRIIDAAKQVGVQQVVKLSVAGAEVTPGIQLGRWHREVEQYLEQSGLAYTLLRPGGFMQNFLNYNGEDIRREGRLYMPIGDGRVSYIDARDIAAVAAVVLSATGPEHHGQAYTLSGPAAVSGSEVATAISQASGRPVSYVDVPEEAAAQAMAEAPAWLRGSMLELQRLYKAGHAAGVSPVVEQLTGCPPRSIGQFTLDFQQQFQPAS